MMGMPKNLLLLALGKPDHVDTSVSGKGTEENWFYGRTLYISFDPNGFVDYMSSNN